MIDYDIIEATAMGHCLSYPFLLDKFDYKNLFTRDAYIAMCDDIVLHKSSFDSRVPRHFFKSTKSLFTYIDMELNPPYTISDRLPLEITSAIQNDFNSLIYILKEREKKQDIIIDLSSAIQAIENNDYDKAKKILMEIDLSNKNVIIPDITSVVLGSLDQTNAFKSGIWSIDEAMGGFHRGNISSIIGESGTMKTMSSMFMVENILKANPNFKCLYFEKEMAVKDLGRRMLSKLIDIDGSTLTKAAVSSDLFTKNEIMNKAKNAINDVNNQKANIIKRIQIVPNDAFDDAYDMWEIIEKEKPDIWVLDYFTLLGDTRAVKDPHQHYSNQAKVLKSIVGYTDTFGIILQQTKQNAVFDRSNKVPEIADAEYGAFIKQLSAYIFVTYYPKIYYTDVSRDYFYLISKKNRMEMNIHIMINASPGTANLTEVTSSHTDYNLQKSYLNNQLMKESRKNNAERRN